MALKRFSGMLKIEYYDNQLHIHTSMPMKPLEKCVVVRFLVKFFETMATFSRLFRMFHDTSSPPIQETPGFEFSGTHVKGSHLYSPLHPLTN